MIRRAGGALYQLYSPSLCTNQLALAPEFSTWSLFGSLFRRPLRSSAQSLTDDQAKKPPSAAVGGEEEASALDGEQVEAGQKATRESPAGAMSTDDLQVQSCVPQLLLACLHTASGLCNSIASLATALQWPVLKCSQQRSKASSALLVGDVQAMLEERDAQLKEAEENAAAMKERAMRTLADMQNLRTRTTQQIDEARQFALQGFAKDVLDVADNLERALDSVPAELLQEESSSSASPEQLAKNLQSLHNGVALSQKVRAAMVTSTLMLECT